MKDSVTRRGFVKGAGAATAVAVGLSIPSSQAQEKATSSDSSQGKQFDQLAAWKARVKKMLPPWSHYEKVIANERNWKRTRREKLPPRRGDAYFVPAGGVIRITQSDGPQIADTLYVNANNTKEISAYTPYLEPLTYGVGNRCWSQGPYMRPITTFLQDTCEYTVEGGLPAADMKWHMWSPHCNGEWYELQTGKGPWNGCRQNFIEAMAKIGVGPDEFTRQDLNLFQCINYGGRNKDGHQVPILMPGEPKVGYYVSMYAEMDMFCVISNCPTGNQSRPIEETDCYPLGIEVFETGVAPAMNWDAFNWSTRDRKDFLINQSLGKKPTPKELNKAVPEKYLSREWPED